MSNKVMEFYDKYGIKEWYRLEESSYSRINYLLHMDFIENHLKEGMRVLDAGCGAGRYSIELAKKGCKVTLFDISSEQLRIAKEKIQEAKVEKNIEGFIQGDIRDLSQFKDEEFDMIICYGAPLSYVMENREKAILEFNRVLNKDGLLALSVNNRWGIIKMVLGSRNYDFFERPEYWNIEEVIKTGDLSEHEMVSQPPRHFFEGKELEDLLKCNGFKEISLGGSPCISCGNAQIINDFNRDNRGLDTILKIELETYTKPTMVDNGEFLLAKAKKK